MNIIDGVTITPLKIIKHPKGDVFHGMKKSDMGYSGFGEAYFSTISPDAIKPWKKHLEMTLNLIVPFGTIKFVVFDDRPQSPTHGQYNEFVISRKNYMRLTIPPNLWVAFMGLGNDVNMVLNIADLEHDPGEVIRSDFDQMPYEWG